ncbi:MAG TPA: thioredoxin family protein [Thermoanaerobaculia bacterium]|nr:thioredoxin family protein [Thermoanaerobaculia bacterium]
MRSNGRILRTTFLALAALALAALPVLAAATVGDVAPAFTLKGVDGQTHSLADYKGKVVVLEWINPNCPVSNRHAREKTMTELSKQHGDVVWLGINSTSPSSGDFMKPAEHMAYDKSYGINYPVLYDESGQVGHAYGAKTTPHMFIVGTDGKLAYNGAIDDDPPGRKAKADRLNYVGHGLDAEKKGASPDPASTKPYGCSVKYQ